MTDFTPRPTVYKGVRMRSRLEAGFAQWLNSVQREWAYEPQAFTASDGWQYLPDFRTKFQFQDSLTTVYIEVKPATWAPSETGRPHELAARAQAAIGESEDHALFMMAIEGHGPFWRSIPEPDHPQYPSLRSVDVLMVGCCPILADRVARPWVGEWWKGTT